MRKDFVKVKDLELVQQLKTFHKELQTLGASLGFTAAEIDEAGKDAAAFEFNNFAHQKTTDYLKTLTAFKNDSKAGIGGQAVEFPVLALGTAPENVPDGIVTRFRAKAAKAKYATGYTEAIGLQLGIEGPIVADENPDTAKPLVAELSVVASKVTLKWKKGTFDGIRVFKKVDNGEFALTGFSISPPYTDKTPLPSTAQVWTYMIQYFVDDDEVGLISDPSSISVSTSVSAS